MSYHLCDPPNDVHITYTLYLWFAVCLYGVSRRIILLLPVPVIKGGRDGKFRDAQTSYTDGTACRRPHPWAASSRTPAGSRCPSANPTLGSPPVTRYLPVIQRPRSSEPTRPYPGSLSGVKPDLQYALYHCASE